MKNVITLFLAIVALNAAGQSPGRWQIGVQYSFDNINLTNSTIVNDGFYYYDLKPDKPNFSAGITSTVSVNQKLNLSTGVFYSTKDLEGYRGCTLCAKVLSLYVLEIEEFKQRYLEVPVTIEYVAIDKMVDLSFGAGFNGSYLVSKTPEEGGSLMTPEKFVAGGQIGMQLGVDLGQKFSVNLSTLYKLSFTDFVKSADSKFRVFSLAAGVNYRL